MSFHEIRDFDTLVNKCTIFDEAGKAKESFYKAMNERKGKGHDCDKPYGKDKGKKKDFGSGSKPSGGKVNCYSVEAWDIMRMIVRMLRLVLNVEGSGAEHSSSKTRRWCATIVEELDTLVRGAQSQRRRSLEERYLL